MRLITFAYKRGKERGYQQAKKYYLALKKQDNELKNAEIAELRKKNAIEYERMQLELDDLLRKQARELKKKFAEEKERLEEEIARLRKVVRSAQKAYEIFAEDLFEFSGIISGQAAEANMVAIKGGELLQAVQALNQRTDNIVRRIERKDERIKKLLNREMA